MFEESNEHFGILPGVDNHKYFKSNIALDKDYSPLILENDPTKDIRARRQEELLVEREMSQYPDSSTAIQFMGKMIVDTNLENKKLRKINEQLSKYYFETRKKLMSQGHQLGLAGRISHPQSARSVLVTN